MSSLASVKLFAQTAILRRRILLRQLIWRVLAGALGLASLLVTAGFATYAILLTLRPMLGELTAVLVVAAGFLALAIGLIAFTLHEPASPELDALSEIEAAAFEATLSDNHDLFQAIGGVGARIHDFGNTVTLGLGILSAVRKLIAQSRGEKPPNA